MASGTGIHAWGSYLPRARMRRETIAAQTAWLDRSLKARATGRRTVAHWDEDALTMAVAAGRRAMTAGTRPDALVFASTTAPFLDRSNAGLIAEALALPERTACQDTSGSQRAASAALLAILDSQAPPLTLLTAADRRQTRPGSQAEMRYGDAAAAVVAGPGHGIARFVAGARLNRDLVHQYRTQERPFDYVFEDRWVRDEGVLKMIPATVRAAAVQCSLQVSAIDHLIVPLPRRTAVKVCAALDISADRLADDLHDQVGETGVGHMLLQLAAVFENAAPGDMIAAVGFGQGCDAVLLEVTDAISGYRARPAVAGQVAGGVELEDYLRLPVYGRQLELDRGIRGEADKRTAVAAHYRRHREINGMQGSRCKACGTPHFPAARVCVVCRKMDDMDTCEFAGQLARLKTFTEDWQAATPVPPLCYGNVEFEDGANAFLELTDVEPGTLEIGMLLAMHFRIKDIDEQRGFRRYFWKPAPLAGTDDG